MSALSTQHSALSTQHSALSTQHSALSFWSLIFAAMFMVCGMQTSYAATERTRPIIKWATIFSNSAVPGGLLNSGQEVCNQTSRFFENIRYQSPPLNFIYVPGTLWPDGTWQDNGTNYGHCEDPRGEYPTGYSGQELKQFAVMGGASCPEGFYFGATGGIRVANGLPDYFIAYGGSGRKLITQWGPFVFNDDLLYCEGEVITPPKPTLLGFFNGVTVTPEKANISLVRLKAEFPGTTQKPIEHEVFENQTGCTPGGMVDCIEDFVEVLNQLESRLEKRFGPSSWVVFSEILYGRYKNPNSTTMKQIAEFRNYHVREMLVRLVDFIAEKLQNSWFSKTMLKQLSKPPTAADTARHVATLKNYADKGSGMVLVGHSQGNLFVNAAYAGLKAIRPSAKVAVVHVAPATPDLIGGYVLSSSDWVINVFLRAQVPTLKPANVVLFPSPTDDIFGHGFTEIYLNKANSTYAAYSAVVALIKAALDSVS